MATLEDVKKALGITGNYQDDTIQVYYDDVNAFVVDAGVPAKHITAGLRASCLNTLCSGALSSHTKNRR